MFRAPLSESVSLEFPELFPGGFVASERNLLENWGDPSVNRPFEELPHFSGDMFYKLSIFCHISEFASGALLSLRSYPLAVTLSGFAGGKFLPFPASKGRAFPFLLTLDGTPTASAISLRDTRLPTMGEVLIAILPWQDDNAELPNAHFRPSISAT
jgi:hypothetical protein